ncbi:MAG: beta-ketoacyl synthase N-terminal-like domain-containing protein [Planctomycetota bacterium]
MSAPRRAVITGSGAVSAAGEAPATLAAALDSGAPLVSEITAFETEPGEPTRAVEIAEFDLSRHVPSVKSYIDRTSALALAAAKLALEDASLADDAARRGEVGLAFGTQWGCLDSMDLFYAKLAGGKPRFAPPLPFSHSYANSPASVLAIGLRLRGHHIVYSTGRASGAWTILGGADAVELGETDAVACVAADSLSRAAFRHYFSRGELLPDDVASPDEDARGRFLLGEGAGAVVIEEASAASARGAKALAQVLGSGVATGADALCATEDAVRAALLRAGLEPGDVATVLGTAAGRAAIEAELGAVASALEVSSEKVREITIPVGAVLGETMGAGAALAAAAACSGGLGGQALVISVDAVESGPTAVAVLLGPA